jgi:RNA polymerase sigma-70 factor (ECF subfamily)
VPAESFDATHLRAGDRQTFEALFRAYHARLCGFAHSYVHNAAEAEELVQDVFLNLWRTRETLEVHTSVRAYLFRAVRNRVLNRNARAKLEQRWLEEIDASHEHIADDAPTPDLQLEESEAGERLRAAIAALPPGCQTVLRLRWEGQLSYAEIAETLVISV